MSEMTAWEVVRRRGLIIIGPVLAAVAFAGCGGKPENAENCQRFDDTVPPGEVTAIMTDSRNQDGFYAYIVSNGALHANLGVVVVEQTIQPDKTHINLGAISLTARSAPLNRTSTLEFSEEGGGTETLTVDAQPNSSSPVSFHSEHCSPDEPETI